MKETVLSENLTRCRLENNFVGLSK